MARPDARSRGYDTKWDRERKAFLATHRTCTRCGAPATVVNHKTPHRGVRSLFWRRSNWEAACAPCHDGPIQQQERNGYHGEVDSAGLPTDPNHPFNR